jgi:glucokinase
MVILAGDIGPTQTSLALFERSAAGELRELDGKTVPTHSYPSPEDMMVAFLDNRGARLKIDTAAFGIAGPVTDGVCADHSLPWAREVRDTSLAQALNVRRVSLLNDLAATANGARFLTGAQLVTAQPGEPVAHGNMVVISVGTGLGEAALVWQGTGYQPIPLEGGHTDLAIRNEEEIELFEFLLTIEQPVTQESILSASGLFNVYRYFRSTGRYPEPAELRRQIDAAAGTEKPGLVSQFALAREAPVYEKALETFVSLYGARAGNLAMTFMATGGVYVGGDIAAKNLPRLKDGTFMKAFLDKGFFRRFMDKMPVHVVMEQKTALIGAAHYAASHPA